MRIGDMDFPPMFLPSLANEHTVFDLACMAQSCPSGAFVEVGVYKGGTAQFLAHIAKEQGREFFGYDTFEGLPYRDEVLDELEVGTFADTDMDKVQEQMPNAVLVKGIFPYSAVDMPEIAFAHIDCDQYQAVKESIEYLKPRMVDGGVMWFDDYECLTGATRAVQEFFMADLLRARSGKVYAHVFKGD